MVYFPGWQRGAEQCGHAEGALPYPDMFEGSRRSRNLWSGGVRLELSDEPSPVLLHSFTHLDPDLPRHAEVSWLACPPSYRRTKLLITVIIISIACFFFFLLLLYTRLLPL